MNLLVSPLKISKQLLRDFWLFDDGLNELNRVLHLIGHADYLVRPPVVVLAELVQYSDALPAEILVGFAEGLYLELNVVHHLLFHF